MAIEFPSIRKRKVKYKGFSSKNFINTRTFVLTDGELIKRDLLNRMFTSRVKGERLMMEDYGTTIPDTPFEPLDDQTVDAVVTDIEFVFSQDPRVELLVVQPTPDENTNSLTVTCDFRYVELGTTDSLMINIVFEE